MPGVFTHPLKKGWCRQVRAFSTQPLGGRYNAISVRPAMAQRYGRFLSLQEKGRKKSTSHSAKAALVTELHDIIKAEKHNKKKDLGPLTASRMEVTVSAAKVRLGGGVKNNRRAGRGGGP